MPNPDRYKDTASYSANGVKRLALMEPPPEFNFGQDRSELRAHVVTYADVGALDRLAAIYFGFGYEGYWWAIALANGITDPEFDLVPGQVIGIPPRPSVIAFDLRPGLRR
jgi:hypothetical protein